MGKLSIRGRTVFGRQYIPITSIPNNAFILFNFVNDISIDESFTNLDYVFLEKSLLINATPVRPGLTFNLINSLDFRYFTDFGLTTVKPQPALLGTYNISLTTGNLTLSSKVLNTEPKSINYSQLTLTQNNVKSLSTIRGEINWNESELLREGSIELVDFYGVPPIFETESLSYFSRVTGMDIFSQLKVNEFIKRLKNYDMWDDLKVGWLFSKKYNLGYSLSAFSLKPGNTALFKPGADNILPTWEDNGIRFIEDGADDSSGIIGPHMSVPTWSNPDLAAPLSMALVFSPSAVKPSSPYGACLFGKTSWGWGSVLNHFGFNYDFGFFTTYWSYDPAEKTYGTNRPIIANYNKTFYMGAQTTDGSTVSAFLNNFIYSKANFGNTDNTWDDRIRITKLDFSYSNGGVIANREFNGLISAAFVFGKQIDYELFYNIFGEIFHEFNLPLFPQ